MSRQPTFLSGFLPLAVSLTLIGCNEPTQIPTTYVIYNSKGGTFQCEVPYGWEAKGGGTGSRPEWAKISSGMAKIHAKASTVGSLVGDIAGGRSTNSNFPQFEPVHVIHVAEIEKAKEEYDEYTELPGSPKVASLKLGPARVSEFTAKGSRGVAVHGYRASIMGHNKLVTVFCVCRESDWQALKPSFDKALATMQRGES